MSMVSRILAILAGFGMLSASGDDGANSPVVGVKKGAVYVLPIRDDIMPPLVYVVRRGVKEAMAAEAPVLLLDINTNGGRVDVTEEIIEILSRFKGKTVAYVNTRAFSAGAFISVAAQEIYMAPQSVIGAAAPVMMSPGGAGVEKIPEAFEAKMTSAVRAMVRTQAEKNGHNIDVVEAMIDRTVKLEVEGDVLNREGSLLTLTDRQAAKHYGEPPRPLLSKGTHESIEALLAELGHANTPVVRIESTGTEKLGTWINAIAPLLLIIGVLGLYIEFKTPGFGVFGIVGIVAFAIYFLGGYVAGLSAAGWMLVFVAGLILVLVELLVVPGTFIAGITGGALMVIALVMAMVDVFPGGPVMPSLPDLRLPMRNLGIALVGSAVLMALLAGYFPKTSLYRGMVSASASGVVSMSEVEAAQSGRVGLEGVAISPLSPGGKGRFGDELLDVMSRGERVEKGRPIRIIGHSGTTALVVEVVV
jgi:membrane-bound serine protease (ClpP class)